MIKTKTSLVKCPVTGQWNYETILVEVVNKQADKAIAAARDARDEQLDNEAFVEAQAIRRARQIGPDKQKIGF